MVDLPLKVEMGVENHTQKKKSAKHNSKKGPTLKNISTIKTTS